MSAHPQGSSGQVIGERREVTVLSAEIVDFDAITQALEDEEVYLITDEVMGLLTEVVYFYEGTVEKCTGGALLAVFGLPLTHENDPERAVRAALEMIKRLRPLQVRLRGERDVDYGVRIGVHTGTAIASKAGTGLGSERTLVGEVVKLARALGHLADANTALVGSATHQRTQSLFDYQALPSSLPEGLSALHAYRVLSPRGPSQGERKMSVSLASMIGRQGALDSLRHALNRVRSEGQSRVVMVTGEAGMGKSRLMVEFLDSIPTDGVRAYRGTCLSYARSKPFWLVAALLRELLQLGDDPSPEVVRKHLDALGLAEDEVLPYLGNVLGLRPVAPGAETRLRYLDNAVLQRLTHAALRQLILAEARRGPMVVILEDLHWVDPASRAFLRHLMTTGEGVPLLLVLVSRDVERVTVLHPLLEVAEGLGERFLDLRLPPLSVEEVRLLVDQLLGNAPVEVEELKRRIARRAGGNPFYAEELVRMLVGQGGVRRVNGSWEVTPRATRLLREIPGTLKGLILARFDRLHESWRYTLQQAAVLGPSFPAHFLEPLVEVDREVLDARLAALEERQFLSVTPQGTCVFRHPLIQEVVYETLLKRDRQRIHERAATIIEGAGHPMPDERLEALAYHHAESAAPARAVPYLIAAAEKANLRCATETAIDHYRCALKLMDGLPGESELQLRGLLGLGRALKFVGKYVEASRVVEESLQILSRHPLAPDSDVLPTFVHGIRELADIRVRRGDFAEAVQCLNFGLEALGEEGAHRHPGLLCLLIDRLAWVRFRQGDLSEAFDLVRSAMRGVGDGDDEDSLVASLCNTLGGIFWQWGNLAEATKYVGRSLEKYARLGYAWGMSIAYTNLGILHSSRGLWPEAEGYMEHAYRLRRDNGYVAEQAQSLSNLGALHLAMGKHARAKEDFEASLTISRKLKNEFGIILVQTGLAQLAVQEERYDDALAHVEMVLGHAEVGVDQEIQARELKALALAEKGDLVVGLQIAEEALCAAREAQLNEIEADCGRVLGRLRGRSGEYAEAEALLRKSLDLYLRRDAPYGRGLTLLEIAEIYGRRALEDREGAPDLYRRAVTLAKQASEEFERLGAAHDLDRAHEALARLRAGWKVHEDFSVSPTAHSTVSQGEYHTATILWVDLVASSDVGDEELFAAFTPALHAMGAIAREHQGRILQHHGGLTVVFGAPMAYEDDTERAVSTAWQIARYLGVPKSGLPFAVRMALTRGDVVAGLVGPSAHREFVVQGEPLLLAERIAATAPPGRVWTTGAVRSQAERLFVFHPAPQAVLDRLTSLDLLEVVGVQADPSPSRGLPGVRARLIGRKDVFYAMAEQTVHLSRGLGGLIWIEGEPGIGKSRLMHEFADSLRLKDVRVWKGRCVPQKAAQPFSLFSHLIAEALGVRGTDGTAGARQRLDAALERWPGDLRLTRPYLELLLGLQPGEKEGELLARLEPEQLRQQIFVALRRLFKTLARERPLVLLLDDLHWIDPVSAELLFFLITIVTSDPILFVCAQRRQGADKPNDRLVRVQSLLPTQTVRVHLERLSNQDSELLLRELLSGSKLPLPLRICILERGEGNPYFIEEFVRMIIEQGYLRYQSGHWEVDPSLDPAQLPLPTSLETLIRSRVDALPPDLKELMQCASVLGAPFEADTLKVVTGVEDVERRLKRLELRLLVSRDAHAPHWHFNHSLLKAVTYNAMLKARRRALHLKVARALESRWSGEEAEHVEELAYHLTRAGADAAAVPYLVRAGERAAARYANEEAIGYFEQARRRVAALKGETSQLRPHIALGLGRAYRYVGRYAESREILDTELSSMSSEGRGGVQRVRLYRELGETANKQGNLDAAEGYFQHALDLLVQVPAAEARQEATRILTGRAWTFFMQGRLKAALESCQLGAGIARTSGMIGELAAAENLLGGIYYRRSEWAAALQHTTRAMVLRERLGYTWGVAATLSNLGVLAASAGQWAKARSFFERSLELREELGDVEGVVICHNNLGTLCRDHGDLEGAEFHFKRSIALATPFRIGFQVGNSTLGLARVLLLKGEPLLAQQTLAAARFKTEALGAEELLAELFQVQAEILLARDVFEEARAMAERAAGLAARKGNRSLQSASWRVIAEAALREGDLRLAGVALETARKVLGKATDELEAGRIASLAGRMRLAAGDSEGAREETRLAREIFVRLGATLDLGHLPEVGLESV
jgi:predicted ATPase/class 3 adenylate cyclase